VADEFSVQHRTPQEKLHASYIFAKSIAMDTGMEEWREKLGITIAVDSSNSL